MSGRSGCSSAYPTKQGIHTDNNGHNGAWQLKGWLLDNLFYYYDHGRM